MTTWGGWVLINMDLDAPPFEEYASVLTEHFQRWTPEDRYVSLHVEKKIACNWKIAMEAFMSLTTLFRLTPDIVFTGGDNSQYDVFGDHLSRTITCAGIPTPAGRSLQRAGVGRR
ncbi:MAG: hypothetical protein CM15mP89_5240 [Gammaproteobacteria bacterium]|nr:MAG: hypothetical protein CM15mP89_5240 [Gammaproteobacteria bacterium]